MAIFQASLAVSALLILAAGPAARSQTQTAITRRTFVSPSHTTSVTTPTTNSAVDFSVDRRFRGSLYVLMVNVREPGNEDCRQPLSDSFLCSKTITNTLDPSEGPIFD
jgi:hypothetical protein